MDHDLVNEGNDLIIKAWEDHKEEFKESIDKVIERGNIDVVVLEVMKELLDEGVVKSRKMTIEEYFERQERLNG